MINFLESLEHREFTLNSILLEPVGLILGHGSLGLEVAIVQSKQRPSTADLRAAWKERQAGRAAPVLLVALHDGKAAVCGPSGDPVPVYQALDRDQVERLCRAALEMPDRHAARRFLRSALPETDSPIPGLKNEGLLATHELETGVPKRTDWVEARTKAQRILDQEGRDLVRRMGYRLEALPGPGSILVTEDERHTALAVFLEQGEVVEVANTRFSNLSPISYALGHADRRNIPWVLVPAGRMLRLYPVRPGTGVASRGRAETYVQLHLDLLRESDAGYLWLLFSPDALAAEGTLAEILSSSADYAADLGGRLRERIYDDVVPSLAGALGHARGLTDPTQDDLDETYEMALFLLFRLLFIAYAEDQRLLPYRANEAYTSRSLKTKAMGSGHFLVAAVDRIEVRLSAYLTSRPLPGVKDELERLRKKAIDALGDPAAGEDFEDSQLLRRQIARRCIYGVDQNPIAVYLARLSLWIHTFVKGLPLSFLDHGLVVGNSLLGIATLAEAEEVLGVLDNEDPGLFDLSALELVGRAGAALERLGSLSDADAAEVRAAREAQREIEEREAPVAALFDVLTAARLDIELRGQIEQGMVTRWITAPEGVVGSKAHDRAHEVFGDLDPFHFPVRFPEVFKPERGGFDVILGNPPWEEATLEEDDFWTRYRPGLQALSQREQEEVKKAFREERPDLVERFEEEKRKTDRVRAVLTSGAFPGMGTGDADLYKAFCWRFLNLTRSEGGWIGVVLPRSAFAAKGSTEFRKAILGKDRLDDLTFLLNSGGWVFDDAEQRYTISLVSLRRDVPEDERVLRLRGPYRSKARYDVGVREPPVSFENDEVLEWTDTGALPLLPSEESAEVFARLRRSPRLDLDDGRS